MDFQFKIRLFFCKFLAFFAAAGYFKENCYVAYSTEGLYLQTQITILGDFQAEFTVVLYVHKEN